MTEKKIREGSLEAPTRHPVQWKEAEYWNEDSFNQEAERVFDICHGCRRCVSLCNSFPRLFDLVDESSTMEVDGVSKQDYKQVVDDCYLCDLCFQTKCPYVPPHEWAIDFPKLMLRGKAIQHKKEGASLRDAVFSSPDKVGTLATIPVINQLANATNESPPLRAVLEKTLGVHREAHLPRYTQNHIRNRLHPTKHSPLGVEPQAAGPTSGKVALYATCYGTYNKPEMGEDLVRVYEHNGIPVKLIMREVCCGMPKLENGDLEAMEKQKNVNIPILLEAIRDGWDIVAPIPSCVLMFRQELPLLFPDDDDVKEVAARIFDPFEYLSHRHKAGLLNTDFSTPGGKVAYQAACHQRVQNIGPRTQEILSLIPGTKMKTIERCSGHDGSYAVRKETHETSMKIVRPVVRQVTDFDPDEYTSDCPLAGSHIAHAKGDDYEPPHPITLLRRAYDI